MACCAKGVTFISPSVKYILFFFNLFCWLVGGVLIGIGVWAFVEKNRFYHKEVQTIYDVIFDLSIIFFVIGFIIFCLGYAGCVGALRENAFLLKCYYITLIIIFLLLVVGAVLAFFFRGKVKEFIVDILQENLITKYQLDPDGASTINWIQENLYCCGVKGYKDWGRNEYFNCTDTNLSKQKCSVPYSCCREPDRLTPGVPNILCGADVLDERKGDPSIIYTVGCVEAGIAMVESELPVIGGIIIGMAVPMLFGICLSRLLEGQIMDQRSRWLQEV